jgi:hypothetical protein
MGPMPIAFGRAHFIDQGRRRNLARKRRKPILRPEGLSGRAESQEPRRDGPVLGVESSLNRDEYPITLRQTGF